MRHRLVTAVTLVFVVAACPAPRPTPTARPSRTTVSEDPAPRDVVLAAYRVLAAHPKKALALLRPLLRVEPDHLEAWVLSAMAATRSADSAARKHAWERVDQVLGYRGKVSPFELQATLYHAAEHYLIADKRERAEPFLDELWRQDPKSDFSARAMLRIAELAHARGRWGNVALACAQLRRSAPKHPGLRRCESLERTAQRLLRVGPMADAMGGRLVWEAPTPQGNPLLDVWVGPNKEVYAVGETGTILRRRSGARGGSMGFEPVASGTRWPLHAVIGTRQGVYAVGGGGLILRIDGPKVSMLREPRADMPDLLAMTADDQGFVAVGELGTVLRVDTRVNPPRLHELRAAEGALRAVSHAPGAIFAVGDQGTFVRALDGKSFEALRSDTYEDLHGVWALSAQLVFAVGNKRTVMRFDGRRAKESVEGLVDLRDVRAFSPRQVVAVGEHGVVLKTVAHQNTLKWQTQTQVTASDLHAVDGTGFDGLWAVGGDGVILSGRGKRWTVVGGGARRTLVAIAATSAETLALSERGELLRRRRPGQWAVETSLPAGNYRDLWVGLNGRAVVVGDRGALFVRTASKASPSGQKGSRSTSWQQLHTDTPEDLRSVIGFADGFVCVGTRGTVLRVADGKVHRDSTPNGRDLLGVWGRSMRELVAVGVSGTVLRFAGREWVEESTPTSHTLSSVWGQADFEVAVGAEGVVLTRRGVGGLWRQVNAPIAQALVRVWGSGPTEILAITSRGSAMRYDGHSWRTAQSPAGCLLGLGGRAGQVFAVGCHGAVLRYEPPPKSTLR